MGQEGNKMKFGADSLILVLFLLFLLGTLVLIGVMFASILRQGDERRRMILLHAGSTSFTANAGWLLLEVVTGIYGSVTAGRPIELQNPVVMLMTAAIVYCASLAWYKRKFGD